MAAFSSREVKIGAVAMVIGAAAIAWMITHPKRGSRLGGVAAPKLLDFTAHSGEASRPLRPPAELRIDEALDFQIEVKDRSYVYVLRWEASRLQLEWGHAVGQPPWEPGLYAPDWEPGMKGMRFQALGEARLYVVASPQPVHDVAVWTLPRVEQPGDHCAGCAVSSAVFTVKPAPGQPAAPLDGGL
jgi:hypothetical protein